VRGTIGNIPNIGARRKACAAEQHRACAANNLTSLGRSYEIIALLNAKILGILGIFKTGLSAQLFKWQLSCTHL